MINTKIEKYTLTQDHHTHACFLVSNVFAQSTLYTIHSALKTTYEDKVCKIRKNLERKRDFEKTQGKSEKIKHNQQNLETLYMV